MSNAELQNSIIQKILSLNDSQLLNYLNAILSKNETEKTYTLTDFEKNILEEGLTEYKTNKTLTNEVVFSKTKKMVRI